MATEVSICNLALSNIGDVATVSSIDPPEGSSQAEHCAVFYPVARDALLELHDWGFSTFRLPLAALTSESTSWEYAYALPSEYLRILKVLPPESTDDNVQYYPHNNWPGVSVNAQSTGYASAVSVPYNIEMLADGTQVIYTDQEDAEAIYTKRVTDTATFSPLFTLALSWNLASMLSGAIIKGKEGHAQALRCQEMMASYAAQAMTSDANQRNEHYEHVPNWLNNR